VIQYQRLILQDNEDDDGESSLAAIGCVQAIRRVLDSVSKDPKVLQQIEPIIFPLLMHGLTPDGLDSTEEVLDCLAILLYYSD